MTADYLLERLHEVRPSPFSAEMVYDELRRVEDMVRTEIYKLPPEAGGLVPGRGEGVRLCAPSPYDGLYLHYLCAQIDTMAQEYESASTEMAIFTGLYDELAKAHRREALPGPGAKVDGYV